MKTEEEMEEEMEEVEVDEKLYEKIEKIVNETNVFNKSNVEMVNLYFFYCVNKSLEQYTKVVVPLKLGNLNKDDLLTNILKYRLVDGRRFNVNGIYAYQFDTDIVDFLKDNECNVKEHTKVEDIKFEPMIELFQHYSSIFIVMNNEKTKHTRKKNEKIDISITDTKRKKTSKLV
jgi:hypothetical protein